MKTKEILIAILNYGGYAQVSYLLDSIQFYSMSQNIIDFRYKVLIWDACDEKMQERDALFYKYLQHFIQCKPELVTYKYIGDDKPQNLTILRNLMVKDSDANYLVFLHNDTLVTPNWLKALIFFLDSNPDIGITTLPTLPLLAELSGLLYGLFNENIKALVTNDKDFEEAANNMLKIPTFPHSTFCSHYPIVAISKFAFEVSGGYNEELYYFNSDADLILRLLAQKWESFELGYPFCYHIGNYAFAHTGRLYFQRQAKDNAIFKDKWDSHFNEQESIRILTYLGNEGIIERKEICTKKCPVEFL